MSDDRLDELLREYGARWRHALPEPAEPARVPDTSRRRTVAIVLAAAAVAVVVAGVTVSLNSGAEHVAPPPVATSGPPTASPPTATDDRTAGVVPWAPLPPTHPDLPGVTVPGWPTDADFAGVPACGVSDVTLGQFQMEGAGGTAYLYAPLRLLADHPCWAAETPVVELLSGDRPIFDAQPSPDMDRNPGDRVLIDGQHRSEVTVGWAFNHSCPEVDNDQIRITLDPKGLEFLRRGFGRSSCNPGEGRSEPFVWPIQVDGAHGPRVRSPWSDVEVSGDLRLAGEPGATVAFEVTLTSPVDLPLASCPDYEIRRVESDDVSAARYGLNCDGVPYRNGAGDPYLPAYVPVHFAMQVDAPLQSVPKFIWTLEAPGTHVLGGQIEVGNPERGTITGTVTIDGGVRTGRRRADHVGQRRGSRARRTLHRRARRERSISDRAARRRVRLDDRP